MVEETTLPAPTGSPAPSGEMGLVEKIKKVMFNPSEFFERIKAERGVRGAFKYLVILSLVDVVIGIIGLPFITFIFPLGDLSTLPFIGSFIAALDIIIFGSIILVVSYVGKLILSFIGTGIIHLFVKLLKGRGGLLCNIQSANICWYPFFFTGLDSLYWSYSWSILSLSFIKRYF